MTFISYSQNFEDVMLWRALGHIKKGRYIDIGAQDPVVDSVSLTFHEHGWHGIHIEPSPHYAELLRQQRSGDVVIQAAVGNGPELIRFYEFPGTGISTAEPEIAQHHKEKGFDVNEISVPCIPLSAIFKKFSRSEIHWLKIDVEGFEEQVLSSWGKSSARPWIVVVESILPFTRIETNETWESILLGYGYSFVYFDGLNRFYVSDVHPELKESFRLPPNIFDGFFLNGTASAPFHHLIDERFKVKADEILAQYEQQVQQVQLEKDRITLEASERALQQDEESSKLKQKLENLLSTQLMREQEVNAQLISIKHQAMQDISELALRHDKEKSQIKHELENLLRTQVHREQEVTKLILNIKQQSEHELTEQAMKHEAEKSHLRNELENLLLTQVKREQEVIEKFHSIRQQAKQELTDLELRRKEEKQLHDELVGSLQDKVFTGDIVAKKLEKDINDKLDLVRLLKEEIDYIHDSLSWRITRPLRWFGREKSRDSSSAKIHLAMPSAIPSSADHVTTRQPVSMASSGNISTVDELLSLPGEEFVRTAYRTILEREADQDGLRHYLNRLASGYGRGSVLYDLSQSNEAKARSKHEDLSTLSNEAFIDAIYHRLLGRHPDLVGKKHYLDTLNQHGNRGRIIRDIQNSDEARRRIGGNKIFKKTLAGILKKERNSRKWWCRLNRTGRFEKRLAVLEEKIYDSCGFASHILSKSDTDNLSGNATELSGIQKVDSQRDALVAETSHFSADTAAGKLHDEMARINEIFHDNERIVLFYVEHTAIFDRITGIQRVCHKLSGMLESCGETLILIKLNQATLDFEPLSESERKNFYALSGLNIIDCDSRLYDPELFRHAIKSLRNRAIRPWLIIPEVTYHTTHPTPPTSRLIKLARDYGMNVGVIFYDLIPFLSNDAVENGVKHANYISTIALADVIWPISQYSANLLLDYLKRHEKLGDDEIPVISVRTLAEEMESPRQISSESGKNHNIVCVGTIDERKNQIALVKAFNKYCEENPKTDWKLHLVGLVRDNYRKYIEKEARQNPNIEFHFNASDENVKALYTNCAFTVFPSIEEGFGLPIVESLWNIRPCICANFSSMAELAVKGGCIAIDTRNAEEIYAAIKGLIEDDNLYQRKIDEIMQRPALTWFEYANGIVADMNKCQYGKRYEGVIYYWVDATLATNGNTGIQRVNRQLAKHLIQQGHKLVPIKWDDQKERIGIVKGKELNHLALWNGPGVDGWYIPDDIDRSIENSTYLLVDLPLNRSLDTQKKVIKSFKEKSALCAAIFYDAIPYKLSNLYPRHFHDAHREYMELLDEMDLVTPISGTSADDLLGFLNTSRCRALSIDERIKFVELPSEFPEIARNVDIKSDESIETCKILAVGTVEPRKNHATLIKAFHEAKRISSRRLQLTIVGGEESFDKDLPARIEELIGNDDDIEWIKKASDDILRDQYERADFTVYPSFEEGFGLPIVESLWFGVPCVCANFGQMSELAAHGGCLKVDVMSVDDLTSAIVEIANNANLLSQLKEEIQHRYFKSWDDYAMDLSATIRSICHINDVPTTKLAEKASYDVPIRPVLSVCITTYNRAGWLEINLENLMRVSSNLRDKVEVVVCDNCSTDGTQSVVTRFLGEKGFSYYRNSGNIGMLGNLPQTVSFAKGDYIWLIGDDDLVHSGALERILSVIEKSDPELINLNYAYSANTEPPTLDGLEGYFSSSTRICDGNDSGAAIVKEISAFNENFYTAIYSFIVRKRHAQRIYSQDTSGYPFSSLQTCVPSSKYVLSKLVDVPAYWINEPVITINMHVSWGKYAALWVLERIPEVYDLAELHGVPMEQVDRWRKHTFQMVPLYFKNLFEVNFDQSIASFDLLRFIRRLRHLQEFHDNLKEIETVYEEALSVHHPLAKFSLEAFKEAVR